MKHWLLACVAAVLACGSDPAAPPPAAGACDAAAPECGSEPGAGAPAAGACDGIACGAQTPAVTIHVVDAASGAAIGSVAVTNVSVPASAPGSITMAVACTVVPAATTCTIDGGTAGTYAFDVTAPGYETSHVRVEVPSRQVAPGACCEEAWVPQTLDVRLTRGD